MCFHWNPRLRKKMRDPTPHVVDSAPLRHDSSLPPALPDTRPFPPPPPHYCIRGPPLPREHNHPDSRRGDRNPINKQLSHTRLPATAPHLDASSLCLADGSLRGRMPPKEAPIRLNGRPRAESRYLHDHHYSSLNDRPPCSVLHLTFGSTPGAS